MRNRNFLFVALGTALVLVIPLLGTRYVEGWNWDAFDFVVAGVLLFATGSAFELIRRKSSDTPYHCGVGLGLAAAFLLLWINAAVGILGTEGDIPNLPYFGVLLIGLVGAILTRLEPRGLSRTMFAVTIAQLLVPVIAFVFWQPALDTQGIVRALTLNTFFAALFAGSGLCFRRAARR